MESPISGLRSTGERHSEEESPHNSCRSPNMGLCFHLVVLFLRKCTSHVAHRDLGLAVSLQPHVVIQIKRQTLASEKLNHNSR